MVPKSCWISFHVEFAFQRATYNHVVSLFFSEVRMLLWMMGQQRLTLDPLRVRPLPVCQSCLFMQQLNVVLAPRGSTLRISMVW